MNSACPFSCVKTVPSTIMVISSGFSTSESVAVLAEASPLSVVASLFVEAFEFVVPALPVLLEPHPAIPATIAAAIRTDTTFFFIRTSLLGKNLFRHCSDVSAFMSCSYITILWDFQQETIFDRGYKICFCASQPVDFTGFFGFCCNFPIL